jgi:phosphatidylglycerol lysyltransferase
MRHSFFKISRQGWLNFIASLVALSGLFTLSTTLFELKHLKHARIVIADAHFTVIAGLSLVYLAMLLRRGKHNAWRVAVIVFGGLLIRSLRHFVFDINFDEAYIFHAFTALILPASTLGLLILTRDLFQVKSEVLSFSIALRRACLILAVACLYGVGGFLLLDQKDFYQEISFPSAVHYTVDQFGLTNNHIVAHSKRSVLFVDSLAAVSIASAFYATAAFFAPIRFRLSRHQPEYKAALDLVAKHSTTSEDFFKLWPRDKAYFFNQQQSAVIAYRTAGGVALGVGDPLGPSSQLKPLVRQFEDYCRLNDWTAAFIHTEPRYYQLYDSLGYDFQKIGEEALVDTDKFTRQVSNNKYFRHVNNKFTKLGYSCELLATPHPAEVISRLGQISNDWLARPGRSERGFMMGYFSSSYMQLCNIFVVKDKAGQIQGFINELPIYKHEANFDFLRHSSSSPGNINDFLMLNFIQNLRQRGIERLNMGLAPLVGLKKDKATESQLINNFLNFAYDNGNRFYSFQGLTRFKSKYEPDWESRYIVYKGGLRGFSKTMNGLMRAMRLRRRH